MARSSKDHDERLEEFVETAKRLFESKGYESTTVDDIVNEMGVAKGLFYYYFGSKDALLNLITERFMNEVRKAVDEAVSKEGLSAMQKMEQMLSVSAEIKLKSSSLVIYFHDARNKGLHFMLEQQTMEFLIPALERIIEQGVREGVFHTGNPRITAFAYVGAARVGHDSIKRLSKKEMIQLAKAFQEVTERLFGAKPGSFEMYTRLSIKGLDRFAAPDKKSVGRSRK